MKACLFIFALFAAQLSWAAERDFDSESRLTISLSILPSLNIESISDVRFDVERRDIDANYEDLLCIHGNSGTRYSILAYGSGGRSEFFLTNDAGDSLRYTVAYRGNFEQEQYDQLIAGQSSPTYSVLASADNCGVESNFKIRILANDLENADSGLYSGALTLVVAPL